MVQNVSSNVAAHLRLADKQPICGCFNHSKERFLNLCLYAVGWLVFLRSHPYLCIFSQIPKICSFLQAITTKYAVLKDIKIFVDLLNYFSNFLKFHQVNYLFLPNKSFDQCIHYIIFSFPHKGERFVWINFPFPMLLLPNEKQYLIPLLLHWKNIEKIN